MKKLLLVVAMLLIASPVFAFELERLEFDTFMPAHVQKADFTSTSNFIQNLSASADFRLSLLETKLGHFGVEGTPTYDIRNSNLDANFGVFYRPINFIEVHYDHDTNLDMAHLNNNTIKGNDIVGVRFIVKE